MSEEQKTTLSSDSATLTVVLEITRANTGKIETVEVVCTPTEPTKEN